MQFEQAKHFILEKLRTDLPPHLSYHSVEHVNDVFNASQLLAAEEGIVGEELTLLLTAALFHDTGFLVQPKEHEQIGCDIAREHLPQFDYNNDQIERICGMIMATRIPQTPHNLLEQILADADLDYLGRDDFFKIGHRLFEELSVYGLLDTEKEWNELQVRFLEKHHFFTKTAIKLRQAKKDENLALVKRKLA